MKGTEQFGVVVRTIGLVVTLMATGALCYAAMSLGMGGPASAGGIALLATPVLLVGVWLLRGARLLVAFAYPAEAESAPAPSSLNFGPVAITACVLMTGIVVGLMVINQRSQPRLSDPVILPMIEMHGQPGP